ncbi:MAG: hypothetical protein ACI9UR_002196, partial [Bacteroidia bacterium]
AIRNVYPFHHDRELEVIVLVLRAYRYNSKLPVREQQQIIPE